MSGRWLTVLGLVAIVLVAAAVVAYTRRADVGPGEATVLLEGLTDRVNDVAALSVTGPDGAFRITRSGREWTLVEKGGYPVEFEKVKQAIVAAGELTIVEPKTSRPESYPRIGVEDPGGEGVTSTQLTLEDSSGAALGSLILGNKDQDRRPARQYVRRAGEAQSYLVSPSLDVAADPLQWIDAVFLEMPRERIMKAVIIHPDGETLELFRENAQQQSFDVRDIPQGKMLTSAGAANPVINALNRLRFEDVSSREQVELDPAATTRCVLTTFDGLEVTLALAPIDDASWLTVEACATAAEASEEADPPDPAEASEAATAEAEGLNDVHGRWSYRIPGASLTNLTKRVSDLVKDEPEPEPVEESTDPTPTLPPLPPDTQPGDGGS